MTQWSSQCFQRSAHQKAESAALKKARADYKTLVNGDVFKQGKQLRNNAIAHVLIPDRIDHWPQYNSHF